MVLVALRPRVSVTFAVTVIVPVAYSVVDVTDDDVLLHTCGLVVMEYDLMVEPYAPAAPEIVSFACDLP